MSFKQLVEKHSQNTYVLPKSGLMKTDVKAFLSEELFSASEEETWKQIANTASYHGVIGAYLMPDCHAGFGIPIGSVVITDEVLIQAGSGYDISCGIALLKCEGISASTVRSRYKRESWINDVEDRIATGVGNSKRCALPKDVSVDDVLRMGGRAIGAKTELCEREFIEIPDAIELNEIEKATDKANVQLGSVGGGNHFIELLGDCSDGSLWIMIHCGSRGYGWQVANHFFFEGARLRGIPSNRREESWLTMSEPLGKKYWNYHNSAANFAIANRHVIAAQVIESTRKIFGGDCTMFYEISHNLIQHESICLPDGSVTEGFVHRKGATRAFPAGHPQLIETQWNATGHPICVPGSMFDGAAIMYACENASSSGFSVNHGSGRIMPRGKAKRNLEHKQQRIDSEMHDIKRNFGDTQIEGIVSNHKHIPLDECRHVYKDLDTVLRVLESEKIAKVDRRLFPIANIKGND